MKISKCWVDDPATRGFSNPPRLRFNVKWELNKEVVANPDDSCSYLDLRKMAAKVYLGCGDQFNLMDQSVLAEMLLSGTDLGGKEIWVVWELEAWTYFRPRELFPVIFFQMYDASDCIAVNSRGALGYKLDRGLHDDVEPVLLSNGWSSRASVFNQTGIYPQHFMEVDLVQGESVNAGFCAPVWCVDREVTFATNGFYGVFEHFESEHSLVKTYDILRTDRGVAGTQATAPRRYEAQASTHQ
jgi:hypothetical protein